MKLLPNAHHVDTEASRAVVTNLFLYGWHRTKSMTQESEEFSILVSTVSCRRSGPGLTLIRFNLAGSPKF